MTDFSTPLFKRKASNGADHRRDEMPTSKTRDAEQIEIDPWYNHDRKTGYIPEHDLTGRRRGQHRSKGATK